MNENATLESHFGGSWYRRNEESHIALAAGFYDDGEPIQGWWIKVTPMRIRIVDADIHIADDDLTDFRAALSWAQKLAREFHPIPVSTESIHPEQP